MEFIEATNFTRNLAEYLSEDEYRQLQTALANNPEFGNVMPGTGGFRKLRWRDTKRRKGRRGGLRIIYYYFSLDHQIWFMTMYDKDEIEDLTTNDKKSLKAAIENELKMRKAKRIAFPRIPRRLQ